ncbi:uncharacterized protein LOC108811829 isoform X1 [Raphanus sativus]|uniref:Uncharacterized protein LOC108811829 isoform X1 n=1 Tax=Raphanus sativus TaxID=3726 RepID=A0A9W3CAM4_RAPSA|nr:PREDICTED: uncharacterized protein LOC108811829 [Raphanus sativus]XP_056848575.1 uncharacterized protein LOC108811829 isoform X1 [Raphanus sativus]
MDAEKHVLTDVPVMEISLEADAYPEANVLEISTIAGQVVTDGEKSKAWKKQAKAPSAKLLSQYSQNPHRIMRGPVSMEADFICKAWIVEVLQHNTEFLKGH